MQRLTAVELQADPYLEVDKLEERRVQEAERAVAQQVMDAKSKLGILRDCTVTATGSNGRQYMHGIHSTNPLLTVPSLYTDKVTRPAWGSML